METTLYYKFYGLTAVHGSATLMADGTYCPSVTVTKLVNRVRTVKTRHMSDHHFKTFAQAALFGIDYITQIEYTTCPLRNAPIIDPSA